MGRRNKTIVSVDIGTTKVQALVADVSEERISIIGDGSHPSYGVKKGVIINMDSTIDSIKKAVEAAEKKADIDIHSAVVGISGNHIKGFNSNGVTPVNNSEIKKADVTHSLEAAKAFVIPMDREVIHIMPQEFIVDDQKGIKEPLGMSAVRLESRVYIITGAVSSAQNIIRCSNRSGLRVQDMVVQQVASSESVLTEDEKDLGAVLIDIGGGTTDIAIFTGGSIRYCSVLPIGGNQLTSDIAIGLRTPISEAEKIKKSFGQAYTSKAHHYEETIEVPGISKDKKKTVSCNILSQIIEARVEETFTLIRKEIDDAGLLDSVAAGAIITGGTALLKGINTVAERILGMPVRTGYPEGVKNMNGVRNPMCATGIGLILFNSLGYTNKIKTNGSQRAIRKINNKFQKWFREAF
jgi:cell division protein FtsA